jgi:hypothetical protein
MQGNSDITANGVQNGNGDSSAPRIRDLPVRRKLLPLLTIVTAVPVSQGVVWEFLSILDPEAALSSAPLLIVVILPMILFIPEARPRTRRHWIVLWCATFVAAVLGTLGLHLSMRLIAPITEPTLLGILPALLIAMVTGAGIAIGVWLLFRRATRSDHLWVGSMIDRERSDD